MCGIFGILNNNKSINDDIIMKNFQKGFKRGPENSIYKEIQENLNFGFHRLAINGLDEISNQPIEDDGVVVICNGEIYNYKELYQEYEFTPKTNSDCEVIIHLYKKFGIEKTLELLDGVFALALYDTRDKSIYPKLYLARDPYGVRPLYIFKNKKQNDSCFKDYDNVVIFGSELKMLVPFYNELGSGSYKYSAEHIKPNTYTIFYYNNNEWILSYKDLTYGIKPMVPYDYTSEESVCEEIYKRLDAAVKKRVVTSDRPLACLLSGGLDSSLITSLVHKHYKGTLETFSIGMPGSEDLKYSKQVAEFLGTKHTQIVLSEDEFFDAIPDVIQNIESYDTTTVRASVGNYLIGKYIKQFSEAKVIFNGDGSDELAGGYMYFHAAPSEKDFDIECKSLLRYIHTFDVLRSDKSISSNGLEPRTPFLDKSFVQFYLSIPLKMRCHKNQNRCEKYLLRKAFDNKNLLPDNVLWRTKEAFSDGVSSQKKSWFEIIDEKITEKYDSLYKVQKTFDHINPVTQEQRYYRTLFDNEYPNTSHIIPFYWMPKWTNALDSSARTLKVYSGNYKK